VSTFRIFAAVMLTVIGIVPLTPPEHAHESETGGEHAAVIHRHGGSPFAQHSWHHHTDGGAFDHLDGRTITLDPLFTVQASFVAVEPLAPLVAVLAQPPISLVRRPHSDVERLIHGPPGPSSGLRAPPYSARL
jgi:hypothetical protein